MRIRRTILLTMAALLASMATQAQAVSEPATRPERGLRMAAVESRYGTPTARYPAVGNPPIARWEYPTMVVYFENDRVIHAVLTAAAH